MKIQTSVVLLASSCLILPFSLAAAEPAWTDAYRSFKREFAATQQFANMGVGVRTFFVSHTKNSIAQPYCEYPPVWIEDGKYDWASYDRQIGDLIAVAPEMKYVVCVDLNTPDWLHKHLRIDSFDAVELSVCYPYWRSATSRWVRDFVRYSEKKYGDRIVAYVLMCGSTDEWYGRPGYGYRSAHQDDCWYKWLTERGLPFAEVPTLYSLTNAACEGIFYDPAKEQVKIDYNRFRDESVADAIISLARTAKDAMGAKKKEIGAFYGYYYLAMNDHMAYDKLFDAPEIDFAIAPATYSDRQVGGGPGSLVMTGSLNRRGKRFMHEIDCRPPRCFNPPYGSMQRDYCTQEIDHVAINLREGAHALIQHGSWWWFDMWGGFYKSPEVLTAIRNFTAAAKRFRGDKSKSLGDVLYVADPESIYYTTAWKAHGGPYTLHDYLWFPEGVRNTLNRTGFVADWYSWEDLKYIDLSKYKAIVFPGLFVITPAREKFLREKLLTKGRTAIWFGAPGIIDGKTLDMKRVERFAGVPYGTKGVSVTKCADGHTDVYYGSFPNSGRPECVAKLREVLLAAGCHAWVDGSDPVDANERLLMVHTAKGGAKTIHLPRKCAKVVDLLTGHTVGSDCTDVTVEFTTPETKLFELKR